MKELNKVLIHKFYSEIEVIINVIAKDRKIHPWIEIDTLYNVINIQCDYNHVIVFYVFYVLGEQ